jgi:acetyltransferase-like isoleucine patch superfamily enzyme
MSSFGRYTYGSPEVRWVAGTKLVVKNFTSIAANVTIYLGNGFGHDSSFVSTYPFSFIHQDLFPVENHSRNTRGDVIIGNDVWIGENVVIMSGVTIGDGAVIANNSHVIRDIEPYSISGGNPCRTIKYRFTPEQIERLLEIKWWDWPEEKIRFYLRFICSPNVDDFLSLVSSPLFLYYGPEKTDYIKNTDVTSTVVNMPFFTTENMNQLFGDNSPNRLKYLSIVSKETNQVLLQIREDDPVQTIYLYR